MAYEGIYRGVVTNAGDPENLGRLRARVPQILGEAETDWAWPVQPNITGIATLHVGDPVWVAFEAGELEHPLWLGTWDRQTTSLSTLPGLDTETSARIAAVTTEAAARTAADTAEAVARVAADNAEIAARIAADNALTAGLTVPAGMIMPSARPAAPVGWLMCDGAEVSKATYATLWTAIGAAHVYGTPADPTNNFLVPNLKGRGIIMVDAAQTEFATMGLAGGSKISTAPHTHGLQNHTHSGTNSGAPNDNTSDWPSGNASGYVANPQGWQGSTGHVHNFDHFHIASIGNTIYEFALSHSHHDRGGYASEGAWEDARIPGASIPVNVNTAGGNTAGESGHFHGLENHNHDLQNHTHTMKNHVHSITTGGPSNNTSTAGSADITSGNLQPYLALNYMIKT